MAGFSSNQKLIKSRNIITLDVLKKQKQLIFMSAPLLVYIIIFAYAPMWGWIMSFQDYKPAKSFFDQQWVGFKHFEFLFTDPVFFNVLRNTICMSIINLVFSFVSAIGLALLLNEIKNIFFKRTVQIISYLPHFLSWIIVTGIVANVLSTQGIINEVLMKMGLLTEPVTWLSEEKYFWGIVGVSHVWKEVGWNTIIYLAAMSAIDPCLYEAANIDGANRYQKMWHITLPGIKSTFIILLIMNIGWLMNAGFEIQYLLGNGLVIDYSQTIDIFVLKYGIGMGRFSFATAAGVFKSVVSITLLLLANAVAKRVGEERII
ncbi:MAG: sugar ABC transporter permease [Spirochaetales bacterium]|nr:sugar ABC transporter permease [Spirochaetales bacterium]